LNFRKQPLAAGLYFVGVPIGTARDITLRALDVLASADVLVAEDTRSLRKLLDIHAVPLEGRSIVAFHDHSKPEVIARLIGQVREGRAVAYASEAGMPLIADPGYEMALAAHEAGVMATCAPGPTAVITALALGGLPTDAFHFVGFLPNTRAARQRKLQDLANVEATLVFYESPNRLAEMLADASEAMGPDRLGAVCRELTKKFEEVTRAPLAELAERYASRKPKGEIVVLIDRGGSEKINEEDVRSELARALAAHRMRDAVDLVARARDMPRRAIYQMALEMTKDEE
jgi:16S rRNA (cytidine1402-2'-O)-methyltransferase